MFRRLRSKARLDDSVAYLIGGITDADVEIWEVHLDYVPKHNFQTLLLGFPLHSFRYLGCHAGVQLHCDHPLRFLKNLYCKIARTGTDLEHDLQSRQPSRFLPPASRGSAYITLLQIRLVDNSLSYPRIFQYMLSHVGVHFEDVVCGGGLRRSLSVGAALRRAIALPRLYFWHDCVCLCSHIASSRKFSHN